VQVDHVHLIVEADDKIALSRGLRGATIRLARAVNRAAHRRGKVWGDRYHSRALRTPREVRAALVYVLQNWKKHVTHAKGLDPCSSASSFAGWKRRSSLDRSDHARAGPLELVPLEPAATWLLAKGWQRYGLVDVSEAPKTSHGSPSK
jgi:hypothetical protein